MPALTGQVNVSISPAQAFQYLADLSHGPLWIPYLETINQVSAESGAGLEAEIGASIAGQAINGRGRCIEWDPPSFFAFETRFDKEIRSLVEVEVEAAESGSIVYASVVIDLPEGGLGARAAHLVAERMLKHELEKAMVALRQQLNALAAGV